jgi:hypothetical protein
MSCDAVEQLMACKCSNQSTKTNTRLCLVVESIGVRKERGNKVYVLWRAKRDDFFAGTERTPVYVVTQQHEVAAAGIPTAPTALWLKLSVSLFNLVACRSKRPTWGTWLMAPQGNERGDKLLWKFCHDDGATGQNMPALKLDEMMLATSCCTHQQGRPWLQRRPPHTG